MPFYRFAWTQYRIQHLAENGITPDEFEAVVCDPSQTAFSHSTGRPIAFGFTDDGRFLVCVYEQVDDTTVLPITAYEVGKE